MQVITIAFVLAIINSVGIVALKSDWFSSESYKILGWCLLGFDL